MFSETYLTSKTVINSAFRSIVINIDHAVYGLLELVYQLFFNVASSENVFSNATVIKFYGRVQLILGVFMMFQLALIILRGIVNPDSFTDKKSGAGNLITRVVTALVLLTVLVPINVPKDRASMNEYEKKISGNGLLFGTLYSLQHRLLAGNTIGKLVLGSSAADTYDISSNGDELMNAAKLFSATVARGFYRINLIPYDQREHSPDGFDELITGNRVCQDMGDAFDVYRDTDSSAGDIIGIANETCSDNAVVGAITGKKISSWLGNEKYMFTIMPFISTAAAIVFIFIFISFSVDVAVRAIKLAVLRLIAPIPIISYMDPKGSKDSSFNSWVKSLTSTYLDLFVRLAIIYFVLFLIQDMIKNGSAITRSSANGSGILGILSMFIIWIGLFVFAKQAPKFIRQILGLKDDGGGKGLFSGLGAIVGAGALVGGAFGAFNAARTASYMADVTNNKKADSFLNRGKHLLAGITGAGAGMVAGARAGFSAKDHEGKAVMEAMQKRNAAAIQRGGSGSTVFGRTGASMSKFFQGQGATSFDAKTREIAQLKGIEKSGKDLFSYLEGKGKTDGADYKVTTAGISALGKDANGKDRTITGSLNEFTRAKAAALAEEQRTGKEAKFSYGGVTINAHDAVATKIEEELAYAAGDMWAAAQDAKGVNADQGYRQKKQTYNEAVKTKEKYYGTYGGINSKTVSELKKMAKKAGGAATFEESRESYVRQKANFNANDKK